MRIPESTLSEIRAKLDIAEVVGEHVALQRKGGRYWGLCPFHQEKSPSFTVTPDKGVFYCFGCHKGGTVFDFIMEVEKVPWRDAVELLAKKAGIEIPREDEERDGIRREAFLELYRRVSGSFHWLLAEGPQAESARQYLDLRGVRQDIRESFGLGYAPADREWLFRFLSQKSYSGDFLSRTGLFIDNRRGGMSALFADRLMFPISTARGEIIAFGGRILGEGQPKYLNTPETAFFRKGENLFGLDKASGAIRQAGCFILVEGYMDVIAMHQAGFTNCVAPLGTALTEAQVRLLSRYAAKAILLFDGDEPGQKATARAIEMLERQDLIVNAVELPGGRDPADFVQAGETAALKLLVDTPKDSFPYLVEKALKSRDLSRPEGREAVRDFLFPFVAAPGSQLRRDGYLTAVADALGADAAAVRRDFEAWMGRRRFGAFGARAGQRMPPGAAAGMPPGAAAGMPPGAAAGMPPGAAAQTAGGAGPEAAGAVSPELSTMLAVAANRELFPLVRNGGFGLADLDDERARTLFVALEETYRAEETGFEALCARIEEPGLRELAIRKVSSGEFDVNQERMVADGVRSIRQRVLGKKRDLLSAEMRKAEMERTDPARMRELLAEKMHLDDELERLKTRAAGV